MTAIEPNDWKEVWVLQWIKDSANEGKCITCDESYSKYGVGYLAFPNERAAQQMLRDHGWSSSATAVRILP